MGTTTHTHTPPTWHAFAGAVFTGPKTSPTFVARIDPGDNSFGGDGDIRYANARLIAAAPELLAALADMLERFEDHEQYCNEDAAVVATAREAIAKATGGEA